VANQSSTASSSVVPNDPIGTPISTLPKVDCATGLEMTGSCTPPPAPNVLVTGSQNSICTQEILQVLTKDKLKELIKACKLICTGIQKMVSSLSFGLHPDAALINAPLDLLSVILTAPQDQHPSQQDINEIVQLVSYPMKCRFCGH
jgi:hypothetical protein